jgi:uncharacterized membrane protein
LRFISTRTHGAIDYLMGVLLIVVPYILGFADGTSAQWIPQIIGAALIVASLLTDYEFGAVCVIPMPVHLFLDVAAGLLLAISPWLFGFADRVFWPHLILGILEIGAGLMTRTTRRQLQARARRRTGDPTEWHTRLQHERAPPRLSRAG